MGQVPAATRALRVLRFLAASPTRCRSTDRPHLRPAAQHGVPPAQRDDRRGLRGAPAPRSTATGWAWRRSRSGSGYSRQAPLQRIARRRLADAGRPDRCRARTWRCCTAATSCTSWRSGRRGRPPLVTDVGVRLPGAPDRQRPGHPGARCRRRRCGRSTPSADGVRRPARRRPATPSALRPLLAETRQRGYAVEDGEVTPGLSSVAAVVLDHNGHPRRRPGGDARRGRPPSGSASSRSTYAGPPAALTEPASRAA